MPNTTSRKKLIVASSIITIAAALVALVAYPAFVDSVQADYAYALDEENWTMIEDNFEATEVSIANIRTVTIVAKGYAFQRIDEETIKQYKAEMNLTIQVTPKTETTTLNVDVAGYVRVNEATYTIESGTAVLARKRHVLFIRREGIDENGNPITLKVGAVYFWWGAKTYALRIKALLQTVDEPMLLLMRGIARIQ